MIFIRLYRVIPFLIVLGIIAFIVYLVAGLRYSPPRAKEILLKMFTWLTIVISVVFALASAYALFEHNEMVFDVMVTFFATGFIGLIITQICYGVFLKHNPHYKRQPMKAKTKSHLRTQIERILKMFGVRTK